MAARGLAAVGDSVLAITTTGYKWHLEQACEYGVVLIDRLLAEAPDEPTLVVLKANMHASIAAARFGMRNWPADGAGRAKMVQSTLDALATAERLLKSVPRDPADWGPVVVEMQLLSVRAGLDIDDGQAVARCEALLEKADEGHKLGMPAELVGVMRLTGEVMLIGALSGQAETLLDATPSDPAAARPLITRAMKLAREIQSRPVPDDSSPSLKAVAHVRKRLEQSMPELEKLEVRAKGK